jgi:hypothetical protein
MRGRPLRRAAAALLIGAAMVPALAGTAGAQAPPAPAKRAILVIIDRVSFEEVMAVPEFRALARAGGAGLLSQRRHPDDGGLGPYLTLGTGAKAAVPSSRIAPLPRRNAFPADTLAGIQAVNDGAVPGLLGQQLVGVGLTVEAFGNADDRFGPNSPGLLAAMDLGGAADGEIHGLIRPMPALLGAFRTHYGRLARQLQGPARDGRPVADFAVLELGDTLRIDEESRYARPELAAAQRREALASAGRFVRGVVSAVDTETLVVVVAPSASEDMRTAGDVVTPIVVARGDGQELFPAAGELRGMTSDSTRVEGLVLAEDVAPTILEFFGVSQTDEMTGAPIRASGEAPFALHRRHLDHRRIRIPVQATIALVGLAATLVAATIAFLRRRVSGRVLAVTGAVATCAMAIPLGLLVAGLAPRLVYTQVLPMALITIAGAGLVAWAVRGDDPSRPVRIVAALTGAALVVDGLFGWPASKTSLAGATVFEGRTYGVRNLWLGPLLAGMVLVGSRLRARRALAFGIGVSLFVGFPGLGADAGGFVTIFASAWLLYFWLARGTVGWREAAITAGATVAAVALLLVLDGALNPTPTHAGRFAERVASDGVGTFFRVAAERLRLSLATINAIPTAWLIVAWYLLAAWLAPRVGGLVGSAFDRARGYREAMWTLAVGSLIAVVANDTGISSAQSATAYSIGGFVVPALALRARRAGERTVSRPVRARELAGDRA